MRKRRTALGEDPAVDEHGKLPGLEGAVQLVAVLLLGALVDEARIDAALAERVGERDDVCDRDGKDEGRAAFCGRGRVSGVRLPQSPGKRHRS